MSKVSAVITTHKREPKILKRAIDSVLGQTFGDIELIVVDDAPDYHNHDDIIKMIRSYEDKVVYIINDRKKGACASRNIGINRAHGEFIALLDDDDEWLPNKIEIMLPLFNEKIGLVYGNFQTVSQGKSINKALKRHWINGMIYDELFELGNFIGGCSIPIMRKKVIQNVGMFDEELVSAQDFDLWVRIAERYEINYTRDVVVNYYISDDAITSSSNNRIKGRIQILTKYRIQFEKHPLAKKRTVNNIIYYMISDGKYKEAGEFRKVYSSDYVSYFKLLIKGTMKRILLNLHIQNR